MGQEVGSCGFTAISFFSQIVIVGPQLCHGLGFVYRVGIQFDILPTFSHTVHSLMRALQLKFLLQGEQCNIVPDNVDDIVADLAPEEKDEGKLPSFIAGGNINWE